MVNILLEGFKLDEPWLFDALKKYILPHHKALVVAFSFRPNRVQGLSDWEALYGKEAGKYYGGIVGGLKSFGIPEENIEFLNYFTDTKESARAKVEHADILYFLGGLPDKMHERLKEFDLLDAVSAHQGIVMGYSAGAVIQLEAYHLSPDEDYPVFSYYPGIPYLKNFYLEVHYEHLPLQDACIQRVLNEKKTPVYALHRDQGAILARDGEITLLGKVSSFLPA